MHRRISQLEREVDELTSESRHIKNDVEEIKDKLIEHTPEHFSRQDILRSILGALFLGFSVLFSGNLFVIASKIPDTQLLVILFSIIIILTLEIYSIGYSRVKDKKGRPFYEFWMKRLFAFYTIALLVAFGLSIIFGIQHVTAGWFEFLKVVIVLSGPCAIGASIYDLFKKY